MAEAATVFDGAALAVIAAQETAIKAATKRIAELEDRIAKAGALASQKASHDMIIDALCGRLNSQQ